MKKTILLTVAALTILASCNLQPQKSLTGKWRQYETRLPGKVICYDTTQPSDWNSYATDPLEYEFYSYRKMTRSQWGTGSPIPDEGTYMIRDEELIIHTPDAQLRYIILLHTDGQLHLGTDDGSAVYKFHRVE